MGQLVNQEQSPDMPRRSRSRDGQNNDRSSRGAGGSNPVFQDDIATACAPPENLTMATSPAFDAWLDRQIKSLLSACDSTPDPALVELVRSEFAKRENEVTD
jgi:hypothetical protein